MRKKFQHTALIMFMAVSSTAVAQSLTDEQAAQVIARVGDEVITAGEFARDLEFRLARMKSMTGKEVKPDLRIRRALMNELVQERILSIAARNAGTEVSDAELEADFQERKEVFDSEEGYQHYLNALKLTEEELKEHMRTRIRIKNFVDSKTGPLEATQEEVDELYALLKSQGKMTRTEDTRDIAVILVRAKGGSDEDWREAEDRAKAIKARIDGGEDFEVVAREVSEDPETAPDGGSIVEIPVGSFYPELEEALGDLETGGVSEPVRSLMGWYVLKLVQENSPGTVPLAKVKKRLETEIIGGKRKQIVEQIVADAQKLIRVELTEMNPENPVPSDSQ